MDKANEIQAARIVRTDSFSIIEKRKYAVCLHPYNPAKRRVIYLTVESIRNKGKLEANQAHVSTKLNDEERVEMYLLIKQIVKGQRCKMTMSI